MVSIGSRGMAVRTVGGLILAAVAIILGAAILFDVNPLAAAESSPFFHSDQNEVCRVDLASEMLSRVIDEVPDLDRDLSPDSCDWCVCNIVNDATRKSWCSNLPSREGGGDTDGDGLPDVCDGAPASRDFEGVDLDNFYPVNCRPPDSKGQYNLYELPGQGWQCDLDYGRYLGYDLQFFDGLSWRRLEVAAEQAVSEGLQAEASNLVSEAFSQFYYLTSLFTSGPLRQSLRREAEQVEAEQQREREDLLRARADAQAGRQAVHGMLGLSAFFQGRVAPLLARDGQELAALRALVDGIRQFRTDEVRYQTIQVRYVDSIQRQFFFRRYLQILESVEQGRVPPADTETDSFVEVLNSLQSTGELGDRFDQSWISNLHALRFFGQGVTTFSSGPGSGVPEFDLFWSSYGSNPDDQYFNGPNELESEVEFFRARSLRVTDDNRLRVLSSLRDSIRNTDLPSRIGVPPGSYSDSDFRRHYEGEMLYNEGLRHRVMRFKFRTRVRAFIEMAKIQAENGDYGAARASLRSAEESNRDPVSGSGVVDQSLLDETRRLLNELPSEDLPLPGEVSN